MGLPAAGGSKADAKVTGAGAGAEVAQAVNPDPVPPTASSGKKIGKGKQKSAAINSKKQTNMIPEGLKRTSKESIEDADRSSKRPKRAAACTDFKERSVSLSRKSSLVAPKQMKVAEEEIFAIRETSVQPDEGRPNRRLTDFVLHDELGVPKALEMMELDDLYITGLIIPHEGTFEKEKENGVKCSAFGRIESWAISGYEDGSPVIWLSTDIADYDCIKPASNYKNYYDLFFEKARACVEVYKKLSLSSGGNPDISLDELLAGIIRSMSGSKGLSGRAAIKDFVVSQGEFIYNQLVGLDETSKMKGISFLEMPALLALRDESKRERQEHDRAPSSNKTLKIGISTDGKDEKMKGSLSSSPIADEDEDVKVARLLQEAEEWKSMKAKKTRASASTSNKFYIKINEDEIANDYPLPAYYKNSIEEVDEFLLFDNDFDMVDVDELPRSMLHDWALYNSDSRFMSLELLPMKPCADIDVTIFGSGRTTTDDGSGFCLEADTSQTSSGGLQEQNTDGVPTFLSAIKEWMIEFGANMIFISIRTDMAWYRLGKPSKQYAQWYAPVLRTAKVAIGIIKLLKEQSRIARLSFTDVLKRMSELTKDNEAFISSDPAVLERYVVVHGQIILQVFAEYPEAEVRKCPFVIGLANKMEQRHHTKWLVKKKKVVPKNDQNLNPRAGMAPATSKRKVMQATATRLISRIWGEFYSNYTPEHASEGTDDAKDEDAKEETEEQDEVEEIDDDLEENLPTSERAHKSSSVSRKNKLCFGKKEIIWDGEPAGKTFHDAVLYKRAIVRGLAVAVGGAVLLEADESDELQSIYFVEYMFEKLDGSKLFHGRMLQRGSQTVLGNAANEREVFLTNECMDFSLEEVKETVTVDIRSRPWGHQHRKENANADKLDKTRAEERKRKELPVEYYCKSLYWPERGAFVSLPLSNLGLGSGLCNSCKVNEDKKLKDSVEINSSRTAVISKGIEYSVGDFVYVSPYYFPADSTDNAAIFKGGRNVGLRAYVVCQLLEIIALKQSRKADMKSSEIKVRRFYRPEDISSEKAYSSDIREIYYCDETHLLSVEAIEGKCEVRKKQDVPTCSAVVIFDHVFFCERLYDPSTGSLKQLSAKIKLKYSQANISGNDAVRSKKGKCVEGGDSLASKIQDVSQDHCLATLDIFAGCGGLSEGLQHAGATSTKWAIEYEEPAGDAFRRNHPDALMFVSNCNVILRAIMEKCGDVDDCISTPEAAELAAELGESVINDLPLPGQVDFINGGPPCQGFSGMNRFNQSTWSKVQCEMILAFLSFADYFRPRYFLLENVRNFVSFNRGQTFRLTVASLLEMGYQVRFGILEAGSYGVSQSRKRAFIWAASPDDILPEWPEPMHVFNAPELKVSLSEGLHYAAVRSTANGAPFRAITVRDTIGDLPPIENGASEINLEFERDSVSWFQKKIRGDMVVLTDHISKEMNELNLIRCQKIPKRPGADWRDLPEEKVKLSNGQLVDLIPWCLPNTAERHNQWKGLFGRLDWEGNFPTSITDPQPMGKVGMCFHPDQDRILSVRECARSQGFPDSYQFSGTIQHKHRQIGNAVPPPLAYALGRKLKDALDSKRSGRLPGSLPN